MPLWLYVHFLNINCYLSYHIDPSAAGSIHCPTNGSRSVVSDSLRPHGLYSPWNSPGQNTGVGSLSLLQGIFPTQGLNPGLPYCRWILYQLSHREAHCPTNYNLFCQKVHKGQMIIKNHISQWNEISQVPLRLQIITNSLHHFTYVGDACLLNSNLRSFPGS